jgi:hypothetical protein
MASVYTQSKYFKNNKIRIEIEESRNNIKEKRMANNCSHFCSDWSVWNGLIRLVENEYS